MTELVLEKRQCLIAGDGSLPIELAKKVKENGLDIVIISLSSDNKKELEKTKSENHSDVNGKWVTINGNHVFIED